MANPQKENGYTAIANEILDHLVLPGINGSEYRTVLFVLRKTYGFNKKQDRISLSQFEKATLMKRSHVVTTIKELVHKSILVKQNSLYSINKNWESWVVHKRVPSPQKHTKVVHKRSPKVVHKRVHTKDNTKDNIQKTAKTPTEFLQGEQWNNLIDPFQRVNPMYKNFYRNKTERHALSEMAQEIGYEKLKWLIDNLKQAVSKPYAPKISKPTELKRDMGKLIIFWEQEKQRNIKNNPKVGKL